jgi:hypothetical protein
MNFDLITKLAKLANNNPNEHEGKEMTIEQELHLQSIKDYFISSVDIKYRKGQAEHGGNLFDMSTITLLDCAIDEALDQVVYLVTLRQRLNSQLT